MQLLHSFAFALTFISSLATASTNQTVPAAPSLEHLFTLLVDCTPRIFTTQTPKGLRTAIPIVGGNFTGPRLSGEILNLGADWGLTDPQTGIFSPDTRYQLQTNDGANIYIQTSGSLQPDATVHLRLIFETGDKKYYWLNNVIAVGILRRVAEYEDKSFTLQITVWNLANEWKSTKFINGTTY